MLISNHRLPKLVKAVVAASVKNSPSPGSLSGETYRQRTEKSMINEIYATKFETSQS